MKIDKRNIYFQHGILIGLILTSSCILTFKDNIHNFLRYNLAITVNNTNQLANAQKYGYLYNFFKNIIYKEKINIPKNYSKLIINEIEKLYQINNIININKDDITVIVYLIESFTDPKHVGIKTTNDPIPFFHQLQKKHESGILFSPVIGGMSANAEFEILTGFTLKFFPLSAIPFIDLPYKKIPSIVNIFNYHNFVSTVIQTVDLSYFNYKSMYKLLGFSSIIDLSNKNGIKLDPTNRYPSDKSVVNEIIKTSSKHSKNFIFAFPNSTHAPWNYHVYDKSQINLKSEEQFIFKKGGKKLRNYLNALNTADLAIKKLIQYFEKSDKKTIILILGDHQPGLVEFREQMVMNIFNVNKKFKNRRDMKRYFGELIKQNPLKNYKSFHAVPYVLWTNFEHNTNNNNYQKGMNSIILRMLDIIEIESNSVFYQFLKKYSKESTYESLLDYYYNDADSLSPTDLKWIKDYELLQYNILHGERY